MKFLNSEMKKNNKFLIIVLLLTVAGIFDSKYLISAHYNQIILPCSTRFAFIDCGQVIHSIYSQIFGIPLAVIGFIHYSFLFLITLAILISGNKIFKYLVVVLTFIGFAASLYFMYLQIFVIKKLCIYCTYSAVTSLALFLIVQIVMNNERKELCVYFSKFLYRKLVKPILFLIDPEFVHDQITNFGEQIGKTPFIKFIDYAIKFKNPSLQQKIAGINFDNPVGLSAGFDYDAKLTQILPSLDFGFETVGTVTNLPYEGNPRPRLGRLPKSKALMVNKGFKSIGAKKIVQKLENKSFKFPVGISIGRTNSKTLQTQKQSIHDIISAFLLFEKSKVKHSYYELNISCPNLYGNISFYTKKNLEELLIEIDQSKIIKPVFIKMPINNSNDEILEMLEVIAKHKIKGVIFGNLQKDRKDKSFIQDEVSRFKTGNFSGKPCEKRSNELIKLAYKLYGKKLIIIGCGGIFNVKDAYQKIKLGASLVQLITGMIYEGPQLISEINIELNKMIKEDGFNNIQEAIGKNT